MTVSAGLVAKLGYGYLQGFYRNGVNVETLVDHFVGKIVIVYFRFFFSSCCSTHFETIRRFGFPNPRFFLDHGIQFGSFRDFPARPVRFPFVLLEGTVFFQRVVHLNRMDEFYACRH